MGQQPLLLLVLSIVVAGGAVVMWAHALGEVNDPKRRSLVFQDALAVVADVQLWKLKPAELDGGHGVHGFEGITFRSLGYRHPIFSKRVYLTENGCYQIQTTGDQHHAVLTIFSPSCALKNYVSHVTIRGMESGDLDWEYAPPARKTIFDKRMLKDY